MAKMLQKHVITFNFTGASVVLSVEYFSEVPLHKVGWMKLTFKDANLAIWKCQKWCQGEPNYLKRNAASERLH